MSLTFNADGQFAGQTIRVTPDKFASIYDVMQVRVHSKKTFCRDQFLASRVLGRRCWKRPKYRVERTETEVPTIGVKSKHTSFQDVVSVIRR